MERTTECDFTVVPLNREGGEVEYSEPLLEFSDSPLLLNPKSAETDGSPDYVEVLLVPTPAELIPPVTERAVEPSRWLDLSVATLIFLFVLPLMALCALAIALTSRGPVIYRHLRIGQGGREFTCYKFRTMAQSTASSLDQLLAEDSRYKEEWTTFYKLRCDPRVTPLGRFLRRYSLDELPQLFNVFQGDMNVVGPRPIVADEVHRYGAHFADYCSVKPGITGLWQVSGRHALSYQERVQLDSEYANHKSLRLDVMILWRTLPIVLFGQNE